MPGAAVASPADDDLSNRINFGTATANASTLGALSGAEIQIPALDIILGAAARKVTSGLAAVATEAALLSGAALEWGSAILGVAGGAAPVVATGYLIHKSATETANIVNEAVALTESEIAKNPNLTLDPKNAIIYNMAASAALVNYNLDLSDKWDRELLDKVALGLQLRDQQASKPQPSTNTATPANGPTSKVMNPNPDPSSPYTVMKNLTDMANTAVATDPGSLPSVIKIPATTNNIHATTIADPEAGKPKILITPLPEQPASDILGTPDQGQENRDKSELPGFTPATVIDNTLSIPTHETKPEDLILTQDEVKQFDQYIRNLEGGEKIDSNKVRYQDALYHHKNSSGLKGKSPTDPNLALQTAFKVKKTSERLIGVDTINHEIVIFDRTEQNLYHGHVRTWDELTGQQQSCLIKNKLAHPKRGIE